MLSPLGERARGNVWLAGAGSGGDKVALKLARADDPAGRERLLRECSLAIHFDHPNIVRIFECGEARGITWITMGYAGAPHDTLTLANFRQLLLAMVHVHAHGVIHADIRHGNLLVDEYGNLRLGGFGMARRLGEGPSAPPGMPHVMSPEQLRGQALDTRTDIFAAGAVLYQVLTGKHPFEGSALDVMQQMSQQSQPAPSALAPGLGAGFDELVRHSLARDRDGRYASAFEFLSAFDAACRRGVRILA